MVVILLKYLVQLLHQITLNEIGLGPCISANNKAEALSILAELLQCSIWKNLRDYFG